MARPASFAAALPLAVLALLATLDARAAEPAKEPTKRPASKAAPKAKAGSPKPKVTVSKDSVLLLIWGGGRTAEDAAKAVAGFQRSGVETTVPPVTLDSSTVKGLNPGFRIAVLGACPLGQGRALLQRLRVVSDGVYVRWVPREGAVKDLGCPKVKLPRSAWFYEPEPDQETHHVVDTVTAAAGGGASLRAKLTVDLTSNGETMSATYEVELALLGAKGEALATEHLRPAASFARVEGFEAVGAEVHLEAAEAASDCGRSEWYESEDVTYRVRARAGRIDVVREVTGHESGLCPPSPEGLTSCALFRKMTRYQALQAACKDATRAACDEAGAAYEEPPDACEDGPDDCADGPAPTE